jgi:PAS domain S-box-containing protein
MVAHGVHEDLHGLFSHKWKGKHRFMAVYEQLFELASVGLVAFNRQGEIGLANRHALETLGYSLEELQKIKLNTLLDVTSIRRLLRRSRPEARSAIPFDVCVRTRSGESRLLSVSLNEKPLPDDLRVIAFREVTVRRRMEWELQVTKSTLESANERLRKLDSARSRYLNTAAHELRIPVTIVNGYCSLLQETGTDNLTRQQQEYLNAAVESSDRLVDLINNMLDLSRFEAGKMLLDIETRDLKAVVAHVCRDFKPLMVKNGFDFVIQIPPSSCPAAFDEEKIERVLVNLISNAVKFTPAGGRIRVSLSESVGEACICVEDNGRGIPEERIPELFDEFSQLAAGDSSRGSGLGLSICKKIIDSHHGRIWVESVLDQGSRFSFSLPR